MTDSRTCESCGAKVPPRMHRTRRPDGKLACPSCVAWGGTTRPEGTPAVASRNTSWPEGADLHRHLAEEHGWSDSTIASVPAGDHHHEHVGLHQLGEMGALADAGHRHVRLRPVSVRAGLRVEGHESSDDMDIMHCPWCGSGQIVANSDGTITCNFASCARTFSVRLMPTFPAMPQAIDGVPYEPGQPGADPGMPGDEVPGQPPAGMEEPPADLAAEEEDPGAPAEDEEGVPAFLKGSTLRTASGQELPYDDFLRHLAAAELSSSNLTSTLATTRTRHQGDKMAGTPRTTGTKPFQMVVQFKGGKPMRESFHSADTARGRARYSFEHAREVPEVAQVVRKHDGAVVWDGPEGVDMPMERWNDGVPGR